MLFLFICGIRFISVISGSPGNCPFFRSLLLFYDTPVILKLRARRAPSAGEEPDAASLLILSVICFFYRGMSYDGGRKRTGGGFFTGSAAGFSIDPRQWPPCR
jgi:hypothetical protein